MSVPGNQKLLNKKDALTSVDINKPPNYNSFAKHSLTDEQQTAVHLATTSSENLKVYAFAGTGKTSTLRSIAYNLPQKRILYLAFNKSVQMSAHDTFPRNVHARTIHSLAYQALKMSSHKWQNKLSIRMTASNYANFLGLEISSKTLKYIFCLRDTLKNFLHSNNKKPSAKHTPTWEIKSFQTTAEKDRLCEFINEKAPLLWNAIIDPENTKVGINHDGYLKLWSTKKPRIPGVDIILLDEAQDTNPVTIEILKKQSTRLILVGDPRQQIYSFRGAVNAMNKIRTPQKCSLTKSFRFGNDIAKLANKILKIRNKSKRLSGNPEIKSQTGVFNYQGNYTYIFRYNTELLEKAFKLASSGKKICVHGSIEKNSELMLDLYNLYTDKKKKVKDPRIKIFKNWKDLEINYDLLDDVEIQKGYRLVSRYKLDVPTVIKKVKSACVSSSDSEAVILTTGHLSKGLEWDNVKISDDFLESKLKEKKEEENLLYVAITRAKKNLCLPKDFPTKF